MAGEQTVEWCAALGLDPLDVPGLLVLEGSWWQRERTAQRTVELRDVRELNFPEYHLGRRPADGMPVLYSCVYGAPRAVEPIHVFGQLGTPTVVQIGSCGSLQPQVRTGDVVLADTAAIGEGASQYYGGVGTSASTPELVDRAEADLVSRGFRVHRGPSFTTSALFAQPPERVAAWHGAGYLAVDMETSAVFSAARSFGMSAVSVLFVWDELLAGRSFLHPYTAAEQAAQARANEALMEVALAMVPLRTPLPTSAAG
ncbi:MAG: hypothetical protein ACR2KK_04775 [Acidimicrobiales bacterium]